MTMLIPLVKAGAPYAMLLIVLAVRAIGGPSDLCTAIVGGMLMQMKPLGGSAPAVGGAA